MCDFYINSSKWEGVPNAVIESLVMKKSFFLNKIEVFQNLKKFFQNKFLLEKNNFISKNHFSPLKNLNEENTIFSIEKQ